MAKFRLVKYHNSYASDGCRFRNCGTVFEILPEVEDAGNAGSQLLCALAKKYNIPILDTYVEVDNTRAENKLNAVVQCAETFPHPDYFTGEPEQLTVYLGWVQIPCDDFEELPISLVKKDFTKETAEKFIYDVLSHGQDDFGIRDYGDQVGSVEPIIIIMTVCSSSSSTR